VAALAQHRLGLRAMRLRKKLIRLSLWTLALLFALLVTAVAAMTWTAHQNRRRAEELLYDIQSLRIGESSAADALRIVHKYGGELDNKGYNLYCGVGQTYTVNLVNDYWTKRQTPILSFSPWFLYVYPALAYTTPPLWASFARVTIEEDRVTCTDFALQILRSDYWWLDASVSPWAPLRPGSVSLGEPEPAYFGPSNQPSYNLIAGAAGDSLHAMIIHQATPSERARAFDISFDCTTKLFGECHHSCELMPAAWTHEARTNPKPENAWPPGISDPRCQALLGAERQD
jgi:cell division protein FtsL